MQQTKYQKEIISHISLVGRALLDDDGGVSDAHALPEGRLGRLILLFLESLLLLFLLLALFLLLLLEFLLLLLELFEPLLLLLLPLLLLLFFLGGIEDSFNSLGLLRGE